MCCLVRLSHTTTNHLSATRAVGGIAVLGGAYAGVQFGVPVSSWVLFGVVAGLEVLRAAAMGLFARVYGNENLSAP